MFDRQGYTAYLRSPEWEERRQKRLAYDGRSCTGCGSDGSDTRLEVHHLTYDRLGHERLEDLMTLCHLCHCREHGTPQVSGLRLPSCPPRRPNGRRRPATVMIGCAASERIRRA